MKKSSLLSAFAIILIVGLFAFRSFEDKTVSIRLTEPEVAYLLKALEDRPLKESLPLYQKIYTQASSQLSDTTKKK